MGRTAPLMVCRRESARAAERQLLQRCRLQAVPGRSRLRLEGLLNAKSGYLQSSALTGDCPQGLMAASLRVVGTPATAD